VSNPWFSYTIDRAIVEQDIAHRTWSNQKTAANKSRFIMLSKKARNLVRRAKREYTHHLDKMGLSNYYLALGEDDLWTVCRGHFWPHLIADCGHDGLLYFSNVTDKEVIDVIRGIKSEAVFRCLEDVQDSACPNPKDT
jgi:hypothetical protein